MKQTVVAVRSLKRSDIDFVMGLTKQENWGYLPRDIERCLELAPHGCFIAESNGKPLGHVFSTSYGKIGWIGLLIVHLDHRGRGVGTLLTKSAVNYLRDVGVETIQLEAVEKAVHLYQRLGFVKQFDSLRYYKEQLEGKSFNRNFGNRIRLIRSRDLDKLAGFDSTYFGANRRKVLESLHRNHPQHCFMAKDEGRMIGYIMARKTTRGYWLGPWVCNPKRPDVAEKLLLSCAQTFDHRGELRVGMPAVNLAGVHLMENFGFKLTSKSIRMRRGGRKHLGNVEGIYGIGGPEKG